MGDMYHQSPSFCPACGGCTETIVFLTALRRLGDKAFLL